jgi:hypothetical protein
MGFVFWCFGEDWKVWHLLSSVYPVFLAFVKPEVAHRLNGFLNKPGGCCIDRGLRKESPGQAAFVVFDKKSRFK